MSYAESVELKGLQSQRTKFEEQLKLLKQERESLDNKIGDADRQLKEIFRRITQLQEKAKVPIVTEHAILRYLERAMGIDIDKIKQQILTKELLEMIDKFNTGVFTIDGIKYKVQNRAVVTILDKDMKPKYTNKKVKRDREDHEPSERELLDQLEESLET